MFQNLNIRWSIIIAFVIGAIYFIIPTYEYYSIINDPELNDLDVDYLREDALKLGLDLQGGLYIILELDYKPYLLQQSNQSQSTQSKNSLVDLINETLSASLQNQTDVLDQLLATSQKNNIDLVNYYSNVLKINPGSSKDNIIDILKANRTESITSILEVMRNRIESHNKYGVGEPTIQQFGSDRLIIELAGVSDVSNAKEYIQRTAEFELSLVYDLQKFNDILLSIDKGTKNEIKL